MTDIQPSQLLQAQHQGLDDNLQQLADGQGNQQLLDATLQQLRLHIYIEEALLFPLLNQRQLAMPLGVMRSEHGQMWNLIEQLDYPSRPSDSAPNTAVEPLDTAATHACQALFELCDQHNPKEEDITYPAIDDFHANDHEPGSLIDDINNAQLPRNWTCAARR